MGDFTIIYGKKSFAHPVKQWQTQSVEDRGGTAGSVSIDEARGPASISVWPSAGNLTLSDGKQPALSAVKLALCRDIWIRGRSFGHSECQSQRGC